MIITKKAMSAADGAARHGRDARAAAARRHGSGLRRRPRPSRRRQIADALRRRLRAERHDDAVLDPTAEGAASSSRRFCKPLEPFRDQLLVVTGLERRAGRRARTPAPRRGS